MPKRSPLHECFASRGATFTRRGEWEMADVVSSWQEEYRAAREALVLADRSYRARLRVKGADRQRFLHSMLTNDILSLSSGHGLRAAFLSRKGRLITDLFAFCSDDQVLLEMEPERLSPFTEAISRYIVSEDVRLEDAGEAEALISVAGPRAPELLDQVLEEPAGEIPLFHFVSTRIEDTPIEIAAVRHGPGPDFDLSVPRARAVDIMEHLLGLGRKAGARLAGRRAMETRRIEAGIGLFGVDMDQSHLLLEAHLEDAVSFTKGCYVGQEVVARLAHRGHLNRKLVGLRLTGDVVPRPGDDITADGRFAGRVTSASSSPSVGCPIALGYVHRDFFEPGVRVSVRGPQGDLQGLVSDLPFVP